MINALVNLETLISINCAVFDIDTAASTEITALLLDSYMDEDSVITDNDRLLIFDCFNIPVKNRTRAVYECKYFINKIRHDLKIESINDYVICNSNLHLKFIPIGTIMAKTILPEWIIPGLKNGFMSIGIDVILTENDIDYYDYYDAIIMGIFNDNLNNELDNVESHLDADTKDEITEAILSMPIIKDIIRYRNKRSDIKQCNFITYESESITYIEYTRKSDI